MRAALDWILQRWTTAVSFVVGATTTAVISKIIDSNDLEWLKAIWTAIAGFFVDLFNLIFSSAPVPVWLLVPVLALAGIPVWQFVKRVRLAAAAPETPCLTEIQLQVLDHTQTLGEGRQVRADTDNIVKYSGLTKLVVQNAIDTLRAGGYVRYNIHSGQYEPEAKGRAYLLENVPARAAQEY